MSPVRVRAPSHTLTIFFCSFVRIAHPAERDPPTIEAAGSTPATHSLLLQITCTCSSASSRARSCRDRGRGCKSRHVLFPAPCIVIPQLVHRGPLAQRESPRFAPGRCRFEPGVVQSATVSHDVITANIGRPLGGFWSPKPEAEGSIPSRPDTWCGGRNG